jgi:DNA-binding PadR family transcriptional regulator
MGNLGEFEQLVLFAVVKLGDEAYGGAIRETIEIQTGRLASSGAINTTLGRLAEKKLDKSRLGDPTAGRAGRPRKYYTITPAGARALRDSYTRLQAIAGDLTSTVAALAAPTKDEA